LAYQYEFFNNPLDVTENGRASDFALHLPRIIWFR
jgi:hypothetical protein